MDKFKVHTKDGKLVLVPPSTARWFNRNLTSADIATALDPKTARDKKDVGILFQRICKNCFMSGRGPYAHKLSECRSLGNSCALPCAKCKKLRWAQDCMVKK